MASKHLYFFAIRQGGGWVIDAVGDDLDDSWGFERPEVINGLVAWDETGRSYEFEPCQDREGGPWQFHLRSDDPNELREALRRFLFTILASGRHKRRAAIVGIDAQQLRAAPLEVLVEYARTLDLQQEY